VRIRVLGPMEVFDGHEWRPVGALKMRALLARLVIDAGRVVSVDQLADELWGESVPITVVNQIHGYVARLRRLLRDGQARILTTRAPGYQLCLGDGCDAKLFAALAAQGRRTSLDGSPAAAAEQLAEALAQWRGDAYCDVPQTPAVQAEVLRLAEARLITVEARIAADLACGRHAALIGELRALTQAHPLRETLWQPYLLALYRSGRQADALLAYQQLCEVLDTELGVAPSQALRELRQSIVAAEPVVASDPRESLTPSQLPPDVGGFVGRRPELERIDELLTPATPMGLPIVTISGPAGVGKTALAVHWAHRTRARFPDGQLYVNLEGFSPDKSSMDPGYALRGFLEALDVAPHRIPADTQAQAALLRSLLADRRMTVLLDNARDAEQVRPLLPGTASCAVVVTSRDPLSGLSTQFGAHSVNLDVLTETEARQLLVARLGTRASAEPDAAWRLVNRCARLPLAIAITAARAAARRHLPLNVLADELDDSPTLLDEFEGTDRQTDLRSVLSWSYRALQPPTARMFRLLGLHTGSEFTLTAAASLGHVDTASVRRMLSDLCEAQLIRPLGGGRYSLHDLLHAYATELVQSEDAEADRLAAMRRLLDHYLYSCHRAAVALDVHRGRLDLAPRPAGVVEQPLADRTGTLDWLRRAHAALLAGVSRAYAMGLDTLAWQLAWTLTTYLKRSGRSADWIATQEIALLAATRSGDLLGQAHAAYQLAMARRLHGTGMLKPELFEHAMSCYRQLGDHFGQANLHYLRMWQAEDAGDFATALTHARAAWRSYREARHDAGVGRALSAMGWLNALLGDYESARDQCAEALTRLRACGDLTGQASAWDSLGLIHLRLGDLAAAARAYQTAVAIYGDLDDRYNIASPLAGLAQVRRAQHDDDAAAATTRDALAALAEVHRHDDAAIRATLQPLAGS